MLFPDGSSSEYLDTNNLLEAIPSIPSPSAVSSVLPFRVKSGVSATIFLSDMSKPHHGKLMLSPSNHCPGQCSDLSKGILLDDLSANCQHLLDTGQLFRGHTKFRRVYNTRNQVQLKDSVLHHVSTHGLSSLVTPTSLLSHHKMSSNNKKIWDDAYDEEFDGLSDLPTWEILTESQYKSLSAGAKALPSMAIATIKYDSFNKPKWAKYRIVVLGNHDHHTWSKSSTADPVMSQLELRFFMALAISKKRVLKNCDVKQAFVQSSLPDDEIYFVKPPKGCPLSSPGTYWRLLRSLYGLRPTPKLWFKKLSSHLWSMGLKQSSTSPCIFTGVLIEGVLLSMSVFMLMKLKSVLNLFFHPLVMLISWVKFHFFWV